ncbi:Meiotic recombination protein DMC1 [Glycine max]|nr:Meiotic recombination protein DMC1 [Glycine max]
MKLQDAGIYTCNGLMMHTKKNLTGIKGLSEVKVDKICEAAEKIVNFGYITGSDALLKVLISDPGGGVFVTDPKKPAGGHVLVHAATVRLMFRKGKGEQRICRVFDAPNLPEAEAISFYLKLRVPDNSRGDCRR